MLVEPRGCAIAAAADPAVMTAVVMRWVAMLGVVGVVMLMLRYVVGAAMTMPGDAGLLPAGQAGMVGPVVSMMSMLLVGQVMCAAHEELMLCDLQLPAGLVMSCATGKASSATACQ